MEPRVPVILAEKGLPRMCLPPNITPILYSPGSVGKYETEIVPSLLSWQEIVALPGPSIDSERPPGPTSFVEMLKFPGSPQTPYIKPGPYAVT